MSLHTVAATTAEAKRRLGEVAIRLWRAGCLGVNYDPDGVLHLTGDVLDVLNDWPPTRDGYYSDTRNTMRLGQVEHAVRTVPR